MLYWGIALLVLDVSVLLRHLLWAERRVARWLGLLPILAAGAMAGHIKACFDNRSFSVLFALPAYLVTVVIFLAALVAGVLHLRKPAPGPASSVWRRTKRIASAAGLAAVLFSAERVQEFRAWRARETEGNSLQQERTKFDYRMMSWSKAFEALRDKLAAEYPFTGWKKIDWNALYAECAPGIAQAEARKDAKAYYKALREFAWRIPDGHVGLGGDDHGLEKEETSGSFGFRVTTLDDGRVVAIRLLPNGPAAQAGMEFGAEITAWNGEPVEMALAHVPLLWSDFPPATAEMMRLQRERFLVRGPVGTKARVIFRNRGQQQTNTKTLVAAPGDEERESFHFLREFLLSSAVETRTLLGGYGYIKIKFELPTLFAIYPEEKIRRALTAFLDSRAPGVILDVRGNQGGADAMVPRMTGFFLTGEQVYEYPGMLNPATHRFEMRTADAVRLVPETPHYSGKVAVLVDEMTVSSGEGFPLILKGLPNVKVIGWHGTGGFFAINSKEVLLPGGYTLHFPQAQSLDAQGRIQVDSDGRDGGVVPDLRLTLNDAAVDAAYREGRDLVLEEAIRWFASGQ